MLSAKVSEVTVVGGYCLSVVERHTTIPAVDQPAALKLFAGIRLDPGGSLWPGKGIPIGNEPYGGFSGNGTCFSGFSTNVRVCAMNILGLGIFPVRD